MPAYLPAGRVWAGILLVAVRVVQGLAFGAEWGGAVLVCFERAPWRRKGLYTGITQAGFPVGLLLANLAFLASVPLGAQWAWRVPFLLSAFLIDHLLDEVTRAHPHLEAHSQHERCRRNT